MTTRSSMKNNMPLDYYSDFRLNLVKLAQLVCRSMDCMLTCIPCTLTNGSSAWADTFVNGRLSITMSRNIV